MQYAPDFLIAPDDRVKLARLRPLVEVDGEFFQGVVAALSALVS